MFQTEQIQSFKNWRLSGLYSLKMDGLDVLAHPLQKRVALHMGIGAFFSKMILLAQKIR